MAARPARLTIGHAAASGREQVRRYNRRHQGTDADMPKGILERLADGPVLGDGGYLLELEKRGYVQAGPFTPEVVIEHPEALEQLHREFLRAGAEFLTTMTFYASDDKLATVGLKDKVDEINRNAVKIARQVAAEGDALVAGDLSLTWAYDSADASSHDHVRALAKVLGKVPLAEREWKSRTGKPMSGYEYREHTETEV
jgi:methionine synthase I (cobalamin-dependent)